MLNWKEKGPFLYLSCPDWEDVGISHGFIGSCADFSASQYALWQPKFLETFQVEALYLPEQIHSAEFIDFRSKDATLDYAKQLNFSKADALIVPKSGFSQKKVGFGIRTADCLPILLLCDEAVALIHAGWRGLASGIIEAVLDKLLPESSEVTESHASCRITNNASKRISVLIGPAASKASYQVGLEVIEAIGERAKFELREERQQRKYFLDLQATAVNIISNRFPKAELHFASVCTISNLSFHSF
ncbi:MAG: polyphenol oxidase family protein, partial [SAR324 cluster bacterium]|nr:polyphenol oxidase family protein [SAR324 cluster bacterium]